MPLAFLLLAFAQSLSAAPVVPGGPGPVWEFEGPGPEGWGPTRDVRPLEVDQGVLKVSTTGGDPGILLQPVSLIPEAGHWVEVRLRASATGNAQLFWFPEGEGKVGEVTFHVPRAGEWLDLAVFPGWSRSGPLRALRLDFYQFREGCTFEIDRIAVRPWVVAGAQPTAPPWIFSGPGANARWADWQPTEHSEVFMSPLLENAKPIAGGWAAIRIRATQACVPALLWFDAATGQRDRQAFPVRGDGVTRAYNLQLAGDPIWSRRGALVGLEIPLVMRDHVQVVSLAFADGPSGPAELAARYFGFEDGHNRAGRPCRLLAVVENTGGDVSPPATVCLAVPDGLVLAGGAALTADIPALKPGERSRVTWEVQAAAAGSYPVVLREKAQTAALVTADLTFLPRRNVAPAPYVPEPRPVNTALDVFMFCFPGWDSPSKWTPIRSEAPERKPLLDWYDEANPECVDWQIKWAVENGISGFILDWYWNQGELSLDHWLRAYRKARYRDQLKLFLLWCDHGSRDVHSLDDVRRLARYWINQVFSLPAYYRIDGRPVVALFAPDKLRVALGGSDGVRQALELCQTMAREAGYAGIAFLSANNNFPPEWAATLAAEGYSGGTTYHEPGFDYHDCPSQQMRSYERQVRTAPYKWLAGLDAHPQLAYYPVVDSGWDSRPWHGYRGSIVHGRTVSLFEEWLRQGRDFCREYKLPILVLGPANEWGEGSYLEPCTEFGFGMYEAVRRVFGQGSPGAWPENLSPEDVGLGPYGFDMSAARTHWTFDDGSQGWTAGSGCAVETREGALQVKSIHDDPTLTCAVDFRAESFTHLVLRLRCQDGTEKPNYAQLFWAAEGSALSGDAVVGFTFADSDQPREYRVDLSKHPRWRGRIVLLRFDPCCEPGLTVAVDEMRFE